MQIFSPNARDCSQVLSVNMFDFFTFSLRIRMFKAARNFQLYTMFCSAYYSYKCVQLSAGITIYNWKLLFYIKIAPLAFTYVYPSTAAGLYESRNTSKLKRYAIFIQILPQEYIQCAFIFIRKHYAEKAMSSGSLLYRGDHFIVIIPYTSIISLWQEHTDRVCI